MIQTKRLHVMSCASVFLACLSLSCIKKIPINGRLLAVEGCRAERVTEDGKPFFDAETSTWTIRSRLDESADDGIDLIVSLPNDGAAAAVEVRLWSNLPQGLSAYPELNLLVDGSVLNLATPSRSGKWTKQLEPKSVNLVLLMFKGKTLMQLSIDRATARVTSSFPPKLISRFDVRRAFSENRTLDGPVIPVNRESRFASRVDLHSHFGAAFSAEDILEASERFGIKFDSSLLEKRGVSKEDILIAGKARPPDCDSSPESLQARMRLLDALALPARIVSNFAHMEVAYSLRTSIVKDLRAVEFLLDEVAKDYSRNGVRYVELSLSDIVKPEWIALMHRILPRIEEREGVRIRFLVGFWRHSDHEYNIQLARSALGAMSETPYIVGVDFMGEETNTTQSFSAAIAEVKKIQTRFPEFQIRIHAGETPLSRSNVKEAIALGATRIGHGIYGVSIETLSLARQKNVIFEFNMNSNLALSNIETFRQIPLERIFRYGARVTLGTDGHGLYKTSPYSEEAMARAAGLNDEDLAAIRSSDKRYVETVEAGFAKRYKAIFKQPYKFGF
jgi:adenosine deaminase